MESVYLKIEQEDFCPFSRLNLPMFCRNINQYGLFIMKVVLQIYQYVNTLLFFNHCYSYLYLVNSNSCK